MNREFTILITDRNRNVRNFLLREFIREGYRVKTAENGQDIYKIISSERAPDLIVFDPEVPNMNLSIILEKLRQSKKAPLIILHAFFVNENHPLLKAGAVLVKKRGNPDTLRETVHRVLKTRYPDRFKQLSQTF